MFAGCEAKNTVRSGEYERSMLIQAVSVCGAIEIQVICFNFLLKYAVKLGGKEVEIPINIFVNCYVILTGTILPTANLVFFKRFRNSAKREVLGLLSKFKNTNMSFPATQTISMTMSKIQPISHIR